MELNQPVGDAVLVSITAPLLRLLLSKCCSSEWGQLLVDVRLESKRNDFDFVVCFGLY